jgi:hypothetical protein
LNHYPLILTLTLNDDAFSFFTALRSQYFPAERNFLEAHLTLFHKLPNNQPQIIKSIEAVCVVQRIITLAVVRVVNIGYGVAYEIKSQELSTLHRNLQMQWQSWLSPQDNQKLRPHITVQNKVPPQIAKELQRKLSAEYWPKSIYGVGFTLWEYHGGPWKEIQQFSFAKEDVLGL